MQQCSKVLGNTELQLQRDILRQWMQNWIHLHPNGDKSQGRVWGQVFRLGRSLRGEFRDGDKKWWRGGKAPKEDTEKDKIQESDKNHGATEKKG